MRMRNIVLVLVAVVVAGMTALMARGWLIAQRQAMTPAVTAEAPKTPATMVLVAKSNMKPGTFVQASNLEWIAWPKEGVTPGFVVKGEKQMEDFIGSVARMSITRGEPVTEARLVKPGDRGFLAAVLQPGSRAMTVPITATSGNAGFVFPGDRVDLILTAKVQQQSEKGDKEKTEQRDFAATVLTAVRVLAIDQKTENPKGETALGKTATLEVTPKQAEMVALALTVGQLSLSLRALSQDAVADAGSDTPDSGESVAFASTVSKLVQPAKPKLDQARSYTLDRELMFMLDGRGQGGKREVTILRGSEEKKNNN